MNRLLARPILRSVRNVTYRQDMPPPGGYAAVPWRRNIPTRGFGFVGCLMFGVVYFFLVENNNRTRRGQWRRELKEQNGL